MKTHELLAAALGFVGGFGGVAGGLAHMTMVDALNELRPPDDQIPIAIITWSDLIKLQGRREFGYWRIAKEFHARFPGRSAYHWWIGGQVWLFTFLAAVFIVLFVFR